VHLVTEGVVKLTSRDPEGRETILGLVLPGELVGDIAVADGGCQPFDAVAAGPSELLGLEADVFAEFVFGCPPAARALAAAVAGRARWISDAALERTSSEVPARLAARLLGLAEMLGRWSGGVIEFEMPLGQNDLGRLAGMCRESACKTLRSFQAEGVLDYRGRKLRILRPDALERIKCAGRASALCP
jgi:CRP-like cAMP-binding protein